MLTDAGVIFAKTNVSRVATLPQQHQRLSAAEKRRRTNEKARVLASTAFEKFSNGRASELVTVDIDSVFRLNDYISGLARRRKVERLVNALGDDVDVGEAIRFMARIALQEPHV